MRLSVALCTYNGEKYIAEQIRSIFQQTRLPDELVICDDMSQDTTFELIHAMIGNTSIPVRVVRNAQNLGVTRNFVQAIALCKGDIIVLSDQDDIWYPNKLKTLEGAFNNAAVGLVFSNAEIIDDTSRLMDMSLWDSLYFTPHLRQQMHNGNAFQVLLKQNYVTGATLAFRASYRDAIFPISPRWIHDSWISIILSLMSKIVLIEEPLMQYRVHNSNVIGISKRSFWAWVQKARKTTAHDFEARAEAFQDLLQHLLTLELSSIASFQKEIHNKIDHLHSRATVTKRGMLGWHLVFRELIMKKYDRYSMGGVKAALRDMIASL